MSDRHWTGNIVMRRFICRNQRQAEAICDIVTSVVLGGEVGEVPRLLVGTQAVQYITRVCQ